MRTWVHPLVLEQWPGSGHAPAVAEGAAFTTQGCWHRGFAFPGALLHLTLARGRAAPGLSSACSGGGSSQGGTFGIMVRAVR